MSTLSSSASVPPPPPHDHYDNNNNNNNNDNNNNNNDNNNNDNNNNNDRRNNYDNNDNDNDNNNDNNKDNTTNTTNTNANTNGRRRRRRRRRRQQQQQHLLFIITPIVTILSDIQLPSVNSYGVNIDTHLSMSGLKVFYFVEVILQCVWRLQLPGDWTSDSVTTTTDKQVLITIIAGLTHRSRWYKRQYTSSSLV